MITTPDKFEGFMTSRSDATATDVFHTNDENKVFLSPPSTIESGDFVFVSPLEAESINPNADAPFESLDMDIDQPLNQAIVILLPHVNTAHIRGVVRSCILNNIDHRDFRGNILGEAEFIAEVDFVDRCFGRVAQYAMQISGGMKIDSVTFHAAFEDDLNNVKKEKRIVNCLEALATTGVTAQYLSEVWTSLPADNIKRLDQGIFCAYLSLEGVQVYVINGFYVALRDKYLQNNNYCHGFLVEWNQYFVLWKVFRSKLDNALTVPQSCDNTNTSEMHMVSLDMECYASMTKIHMSGSPLEALSERIVWFSVSHHDVSHDAYGRHLLSKGIPEKIILEWCSNPLVKMPYRDEISDHEQQNIFEVVNDMDVLQCTEKLLEIYDYELFKNEIPHRNCIFKCTCVLS